MYIPGEERNVLVAVKRNISVDTRSAHLVTEIAECASVLGIQS